MIRGKLLQHQGRGTCVETTEAYAIRRLEKKQISRFKKNPHTPHSPSKYGLQLDSVGQPEL